MSLKNFTFAQICQMIIGPAFFDTLKMLLISGILSTLFGFIFGVVLIVTEKGGLYENVVLNRILDFIVNTIRSFPFIILMVSIIPFTRLVVGSSIGDTAAHAHPLWHVFSRTALKRLIRRLLRRHSPSGHQSGRSYSRSC